MQFKVLLSGVEDSGDHVLIDAAQSYVGGSGIQRRLQVTEQRLIQAEQLLRYDNLTVAEVVHRSGYSNQGHFAAAFKRKFGITPNNARWARNLFRASPRYN